ncbi:MAG: hypothetical protein KAJ14_16305 [Candidatus Omnitrophica bacterium]|nr:hypothetical protein [Candidatus Omnitrophota bacterium]
MFTIFLIIALIISLNFNMAIDSLLSLFLSIYMLSLISQKIRRRINDTILIILVFSIIITFTISWIFKIQLSFIGVIDDNKMLVLVTFLYVFLTYKIMKNSFTLFELKRIPDLKIEMNDSFNKYEIKNITEFPAKDIRIIIEVLHPIPKGLYDTINLWLRRNIETLNKNKLSKKKPHYITILEQKTLNKDNSILINLNDDLFSSIPLNKFTKEVNKGVTLEDEILFYSEKEQIFEVIIKCEYKSIDNLKISPRFQSLTFKTKRKEEIKVNDVELLSSSEDLRVVYP